MSVYAVVQFLNGALQKECAVVPIIWLMDNNSICYWPNTKSDVKKALVKSNAIYESSWKQFDVDTVLHTEGMYIIINTYPKNSYSNLLYVKLSSNVCFNIHLFTEFK